MGSARSILHDAGGGLDPSLRPCLLSPTSVFYDSIRSKARELGFQGKKFPFSFRIDGESNEQRLNFTLHLYGTRVLIATIRLDPIGITGSADEVLRYRDLANQTNIAQLSKLIVRLI